TTLRVIVKMLKQYGGASEVHVRVACPPIMAPCSYGIDMSTVSELIAPQFFDEPVKGELAEDGLAALAADLGADSLRYLTVEELNSALGLSECELCEGCLTGEYPTDWGQKLYKEALLSRDCPTEGRTYERLGLGEEGEAGAGPDGSAQEVPLGASAPEEGR
ncbi:MAG: amidophosphoribosyltransferase, partial [Planctomycetota bacterium]|nr:amidophosphoribosyltransferase [Planctomycetota bacterium]